MNNNKAQSRILLTGGHLTPALAVYEKLWQKGYYNVIWVGTKYSQTFSFIKSAEYTEVRRREIKFIPIHAGKTWMKWTKATLFKGLTNFLMIPLGFIEAFFIVLLYKPKLIVSFGGYIALPLVACGSLLHIPSITHEQTITKGKSNRMISGFAKKIMVSWDTSLNEYDSSKVVLTGNPIRQEILNPSTDIYKFRNDLPIIYITGGNQGSNTINWRVYEFLPDLLKIANVIHQTGRSAITHDYEKAVQTYNHLPNEIKGRYVFFDNIFGPEIGEILNKADLILTRAGANTVSEIIALGKYALFIPIPWSSQNEQQLNAEYAAKLGNGEILLQRDDMKPNDLFAAIKEALKNALTKSKKRILNNPMPVSAADKIFTIIKDEL